MPKKCSSLRLKLLGAAIGILELRVARVDDEIAFGKERDHFRDNGIHRLARRHQ